MRNVLIQSPGILVEAPSPSFRETMSAWSSLAVLESDYPGFGLWFWKMVSPGLSDGTRRLWTVEAGGRTVAAAIAKRGPDENKVCTLWVDPCSRGRGHGSALASAAVEWLGDSREIVATVREERLAGLSPIFRKHGFARSGEIRDAYGEGTVEVEFRRPPLDPGLAGRPVQAGT